MVSTGALKSFIFTSGNVTLYNTAPVFHFHFYTLNFDNLFIICYRALVMRYRALVIRYRVLVIIASVIKSGCKLLMHCCKLPMHTVCPLRV